MPHVPNVIRDDANGITYTVMAFRQLTQQERIVAVRRYLARQGGKALGRGSQVKIITTIGA